MKRLLTLALSAIMLLASFSFVGCFGEDRTEKDEAGKVQLNVAYANLGYGDYFYKWVCEEFEKTYTKYDVQVKANDRTSAQGNGDVGISSLDDDVTFYGFQKPHDFIGSMSEMTDAYLEKAYDDNYNFVGRGAPGATVALADRLSDKDLNMLNYNDVATKWGEREIYGVPLQVGLYGFWYDVDLFRDNGLLPKTIQEAAKLGYKGYDLVAGNEDDWMGPDHTAGTTDDGLPATYEDFKLLMKYMSKRNISKNPFIWTGQHVWMSYRGSEQVAMSYEGYNNYSILSTFDGQFRTGLDANGNPVYETIEPDTAYKLYDNYQDADGNYVFPYRKGITAAAIFAEYIAQNSLYADACIDGSSHTAAQIKFLDGKFINDRNAFLIEGVHWQYEARAKFEEDAELEGPENGLDQRSFAFFPIPRFKGSAEIEDQTHDKNVVTMTGGGPAVTLLKNAEREDDDTGVSVLEVAKDFMLFLNDNSVLRKMAAEWRVLPNAAVKMTAAEEAAMNPMVVNMVNVLAECEGENAVSEVCYLAGGSLCRSNGKTASYYEALAASNALGLFGARLGKGGSANETVYMLAEICVKHFNGQNVTAKDWMNGVKKMMDELSFSQAKWSAWIRG